MSDLRPWIFHIFTRCFNILVSPAGQGDLLKELQSFIPFAARKPPENVTLLRSISYLSALLIGMVGGFIPNIKIKLTRGFPHIDPLYARPHAGLPSHAAVSTDSRQRSEKGRGHG